MTDKTQYCELCEAAQREIAELRAARLKPIDEAIELITSSMSKFHTADRSVLNIVIGYLNEIRAKYAGGKP